ncbi:lecithin retinol acyltransferase family protein [Pseudoduganella sp. OTU4001]|uniref:lecithin retinol acyltransferase family protein n=1 Tax=Pseudoduganella sp. OTU4001 TaxID=3043854 RepID=UPI00313BAE16
MFPVAAYYLLGLWGSKVAYDSFSGGIIDEPVPGSILYSSIVTGVAEHSGVFIGDGQIVHLNGDGEIESVSAQTFMNRLGGLSTGLAIYVSSNGTGAVGSVVVAERARSMIGKRRDYGLLMDNCHQFSAGCLTGNFENATNFMWMLKDEATRVLGTTRWAHWMFDQKREENRFAAAAHVERLETKLASVHAALEKVAAYRTDIEAGRVTGDIAVSVDELLEREAKLNALTGQLKGWIIRLRAGEVRITE